MENHTKMDDTGVSLFQESPAYFPKISIDFWSFLRFAEDFPKISPPIYYTNYIQHIFWLKGNN